MRLCHASLAIAEILLEAISAVLPKLNFADFNNNPLYGTDQTH